MSQQIVRVSSQAPQRCEAKAAWCEGGQKTQLTSQMRDGSSEEHCQTPLSAQNSGNGSPDSAALGDQAGTWRSCHQGFLTVACLSAEVIWGWPSPWPTLVELKEKNIYLHLLPKQSIPVDFCLEKGVEFVDINYLSPSAAILFGKGIEQKSIQQCVNTHAAAFL